MRNNYIIILIICAFSQSCNPFESSDNNLEQELNEYKQSFFIKDIPKTRLGAPVPSYTMIREIENDLQLSKMESGADSIRFRIWDGNPASDWLVEIRKVAGKWEGEYITYRIHRENVNDTFQIEKKSVDKIPKNGWNNLIKKLISYQIVSLPDAHMIENYGFSTHADQTIIEIAAKNFYRFYTYENPYFMKTRIKEASNIVNIIELVKNEFMINEELNK